MVTGDGTAAPNRFAGHRRTPPHPGGRGGAHGRARGVRGARRQEPVTQRLRRPGLRIGPRVADPHRHLRAGRRLDAGGDLLPGRRRQPGRARRREPHRAADHRPPAGRDRVVGMDDAAGGGRRPRQQGPHRRTGRRGDHRHRSRAADLRPTALRRGDPRRARRRHGAHRRHRDGQRPDHRAFPAGPAVDGGSRDPAELPGPGLGVRRPAGRGAARRDRRDGGRRGARGAAGGHASPPTCRSSR